MSYDNSMPLQDARNFVLNQKRLRILSSTSLADAENPDVDKQAIRTSVMLGLKRIDSK